MNTVGKVAANHRELEGAVSAQVLNEIAEGEIDQRLMMKAYQRGEGNQDKAMALYSKYRCAELRRDFYKWDYKKRQTEKQQRIQQAHALRLQQERSAKAEAARIEAVRKANIKFEAPYHHALKAYENTYICGCVLAVLTLLLGLNWYEAAEPKVPMMMTIFLLVLTLIFAIIAVSLNRVVKREKWRIDGTRKIV